MNHIGPSQLSVGTPSLKLAPALEAGQAGRPPPETQEDRAEFSEISLHLSAIHDVPDARVGKVAEVRAAIARGHYDGEEVLAETVDRLIDDLLQEEISY